MKREAEEKEGRRAGGINFPRRRGWAREDGRGRAGPDGGWPGGQSRGRTVTESRKSSPSAEGQALRRRRRLQGGAGRERQREEEEGSGCGALGP